MANHIDPDDRPCVPATAVYTTTRRPARRSKQLLGWLIAVVNAQGGGGGVNLAVWTEHLEITDRSTGTVVATITNTPGSMFDTVSQAERDLTDTDVDQFRTRWIPTV